MNNNIIIIVRNTHERKLLKLIGSQTNLDEILSGLPSNSTEQRFSTF